MSVRLRMIQLLSIAMFLGGCAALLAGSWIQLKAGVAQWLLQSAWERTLIEGGRQRPWPWADHWPVARLIIDGRSNIVLAGDHGAALAFGPGHSPRSGLPGQRITSVISGHRDTHFAVLRRLSPGDGVIAQTAQGLFHYRVTEIRILDAGTDRIALDQDQALELVTCWSPDGVRDGGRRRLVVRAEPLDI